MARETPTIKSKSPWRLPRGAANRLAPKLERCGLGQLNERLKEGSTIDELAAAVRHAVYELGLLGGEKAIYQAAHVAAVEWQARDGIVDPVRNEETEVFTQRMRETRTALCLDALLSLEQPKRDAQLGDVRARNLKPDEALARRYIPEEECGEAELICADTPTDALLSIIALAEKPEFADNDICQQARGAAQEFLLRRLVSGNTEFIATASKFFQLRHFNAVLEQMPDALSKGRIGGKAAGILLANAALEQETPDFDAEFARSRGIRNMGEFVGNLRRGQTTSRFVGSRVFETVLQYNHIAGTALLKRGYANGTSVPDDAVHEKIRQQILNAKFPEYIERQLRVLFLNLKGGPKRRPAISRSSSELEDLKGASFAGQYESVELANSNEDREDDEEDIDFEKFKKAILIIYASVFSKNVMSYRKEHGLLAEDEEMANLNQLLVGEKWGENYYAPHFSIVAMSRATQAFGLDASRGAMRVVVGLGERAVNGEGRFVLLAKPKAVIGGNANSIKAQTLVTCMDLKSGEKVEVEYEKLKKSGCVPNGVIGYGETGRGDENLTCEGLLQYTNVALQVEYIIQKLKHQLGYDVDCEFALQIQSGKPKITPVQCRPQAIAENLKPSTMPEDVPDSRVLFSSDKTINSSMCVNMTHLVYIDPSIFSELRPSDRSKVRRYMARVNDRFEGDKKKNFMIIAPKRWGAMDDHAGLPANYSDFNNTACVMETYESGHEEDISFGAHFFQRFMDDNIGVAAFNSDQMSDSSRRFFAEAAHDESLPPVPDVLKPYVKVINVDDAWRASTGQEKGKGRRWCVHLAQDPTHGEKEVRPARMYIAKRDRDLPAPVAENGNHKKEDAEE